MRKTDSMVTLQFILLINELLYKNNASISACMIMYKLGKIVKISFSTRCQKNVHVEKRDGSKRSSTDKY